MNEPEGQSRSPVIANLTCRPGRSWRRRFRLVDPHEMVPALIELNVTYPGGLVAVREAFYSLWEREFVERAGGVVAGATATGH
jgi:hypothetical protein